jgi:hypothetical protein
MLRSCKTFIAVSVALLSAAVLAPALAATPEEAKTLCQKAVALVEAEGEGAFAKISDAKGEFLQGEMGVTVIDKKGIVRASYLPKLIGVDTWEIVDPDGVKFGQDGIKLAESAGSGWLHFKNVNPVSRKIEPKVAWIQKAGDFVVFAATPIH